MNTQSLQTTEKKMDDKTLEKVIIAQDVADLSGSEKVMYIKKICESIGLNPVTKPIQIIKFQGKEMLYFTKDATEQLRKINKVSLSIKETKVIDDIYIVIAEATTPDGRTDCATAAINIAGLKGDAKANAFMKGETKAKRRVTLSICGLGFMDESETDTLGPVKRINNEPQASITIIEDNDNLKEQSIMAIQESKTIDELKDVFVSILKSGILKNNPDLAKVIVDAKEEKKKQLLTDEFKQEWDNATGEINTDKMEIIGD